MIYIDNKYIGLISARLPLFKRRNDSYNFRCVLCGDSQTHKHKTRGYIYRKDNSMLYYCHNCHASMSLGNFLKIIDPELYKEYVQENFIEKNAAANVISKPDITQIVRPKYITDSPLKKLKKVSQLDWDHPVKKYVSKRKIPTKFHAKLFYAPKFKRWINEIIPDKFSDVEHDEPRLIIPLIDSDQNCFGIQGRGFKSDGIRYITIIFDDTKPKIYGLDAVDFNQRVYVTEGPIDSMFLPNAIAMAGSDGVRVINELAGNNKKNIVFVYDNEPRNKDICKIMDKVIEMGYNTTFWPDHIEQKDINDMVLAGIKPVDIKLIIDNNTYVDLQAKMKMVTWRKS